MTLSQNALDLYRKLQEGILLCEFEFEGYSTHTLYYPSSGTEEYLDESEHAAAINLSRHGLLKRIQQVDWPRGIVELHPDPPIAVWVPKDPFGPGGPQRNRSSGRSLSGERPYFYPRPLLDSSEIYAYYAFIA